MTRLVEDQELREAFKSGERGALTEVFREYARPVFALLRRGFSFQSAGKSCYFKGFSETWELENMVQEVFLRAFAPEARLAYDGLRPYRNYLFSIARNLVIDSFRGSRPEFVEIEELPDQDSAEFPELARAEPSPEEVAARQELAARVEAFLKTLSADDRAIFEVRFKEGHSIETSAARLGVSEHRVKKGEKQIRKRFFQYMKKLGYFEGYRYGRGGLDRVVMMLMLGLGACR